MPTPQITNPVEKFVWTELTREGLDLVGSGGVKNLVKFLERHDVTADGVTQTTDHDGQVDSQETSFLKGLLDNPDYLSLFDDSGVSELQKVLGISDNSRASSRGRDATGDVPQGTVPGNFANRLNRSVSVKHAARLFIYDYQQKRTSVFEDPYRSEGERAKMTLYLLQDYAEALNNAGQGPQIAEARTKLLEAFFTLPYACVHGSSDPDDDLLVTAWEIVWGTNPEKPESHFDIDREGSWSAYMSMCGEFVNTAMRIDEYLEAQGKPAKVVKHEKLSPLNWIVGETTGNSKPSSIFSEENAIQSTGVDFSVKLLENERSVGERTLDPQFDMRVDFYAFNNFVRLNKHAGDRLEPIHDETQETLKVEVEHVGDEHWRPVFRNSAGETIDPSAVTVVIKDRDGTIKGDGKANGSYSASWWGFCCRNAQQGLVTMKYGFPKPQKDVTLKVGEKEFCFDKSDVTKIVGRRLTEIIPTNTQAGNRYDEEPDRVHLKDGGTILGKIETEIDFRQPDTVRDGDNMVLAPEQMSEPVGFLLLRTNEGEERQISAKNIDFIERKPASIVRRTPEDSVVLQDGSCIAGSLVSKLSFQKAIRKSDGTLVRENAAQDPIAGDISFRTVRGEQRRIALGDVAFLVREDEKEILAEEALAYVVRNRGMFCADSWSGSSVANGTRTIDTINRYKPGDADRPEWVPVDLENLKGYRGRVENPDNLLFFRLQNEGSHYGGLTFWLETDEHGMPINSDVINGQWDFLWGLEGQPNWDARPTFNPHVPNELVLSLYVNSLENPQEHEKVLPSNWRDYLMA